jgi:hypothetical protein
VQKSSRLKNVPIYSAKHFLFQKPDHGTKEGHAFLLLRAKLQQQEDPGSWTIQSLVAVELVPWESFSIGKCMEYAK